MSDINTITDQVSVERVVAALTAAAPVILTSFHQFQTLPVATQVAIILVIGAAGIVWLQGRVRWTINQDQLNAYPPVVPSPKK